MRTLVFLAISLFVCFTYLIGQAASPYKVMCYNVENYFDCIDDTLTDDSEFLPTSMRAWNVTKYKQKQANIAKVIVAIGGWEAPALVGLCEVESEKCLVDLTRYSGLRNLQYRFIHYESPDARGVDVALLYQPSLFQPIHAQPLRIVFPDAPQRKTRDVLFATGLLPTGDTLHVFVCHFPSRLGGELESEPSRLHVASVVRAKVDSLFQVNASANILVMGDFNDFPTNKSCSEVLGAKADTTAFKMSELYNLTYQLHVQGKGSNKHQGEWGALDQLIVSGHLLDSSSRFFTNTQTTAFLDVPFLLEEDAKYLGKMPFRTYLGMKYHNGYSDHLPVFTEFFIKE